MKSTRGIKGKRRERRGVLTFEWILLISLLVIGIIGGLSSVRNALLCELQDLSACIEALNFCSCGDTPCATTTTENVEFQPWYEVSVGD